MEHVDLAGIRVAFRRKGVGPCLVLLHGALSDSRVWRVELESLSDVFTVVAWDAPGCGESSDPPEYFRMPEFAECLGRFIDALDVPSVHLLGHSFGSALALELYRQRPALVRSLVLVGAYAGWAGSLSPAEVEERLDLALRLASRATSGFDAEALPGLFSDVMPADRAAELTTIMSEVRPTGVRAMAYGLAEADLRDVLPGIDVPTLLLYGDADERAPLNVARDLHASIPGSTLMVLPGLGHECYLESAETFDGAVREFLLSLGA